MHVRLVRKALPASARPTCCSGREQRLAPAHAGGAHLFPPSAPPAGRCGRSCASKRRGLAPIAARPRRASRRASTSIAPSPAARASASRSMPRCPKSSIRGPLIRACAPARLPRLPAAHRSPHRVASTSSNRCPEGAKRANHLGIVEPHGTARVERALARSGADAARGLRCARHAPRHGRRLLRSHVRLSQHPCRAGDGPRLVGVAYALQQCHRSRRRPRRAAGCGGHRTRGHPMSYWLMKTEPEHLQHRGPGPRPAQHHLMGRRTQFSGAQHASRPDEEGRSGLHLLLEHRCAGHRGRDGDHEGGLPRHHGLRSQASITTIPSRTRRTRAGSWSM